MKIEIYIKRPSSYTNVEEYKKIIGNSKVKAYTLDDDCNIVEGEGCIASDGSYNYHNNYDDSEDVMWFNNKQQWFTQNFTEIEKLQKENAAIIKDRLTKIIDKL